jgi:hypothetical protein
VFTPVGCWIVCQWQQQSPAVTDDTHYLVHREARLTGEFVFVLHGITGHRDLPNDTAETGNQQGRERGCDQQFDQSETVLVWEMVRTAHPTYGRSIMQDGARMVRTAHPTIFGTRNVSITGRVRRAHRIMLNHIH